MSLATVGTSGLKSGLALGDLANNIASATQGLLTAFGLAQPNPVFKEFLDQGITSTFQREQWYKTPSQGFYSFSVDKVGQGVVSEFPAFIQNIQSTFGTVSNLIKGESSDVVFGEFKLPITPQEITQTEDFAVSIKPTQGGTVVNHSGNKYKTLTISGTTGVQPNKGLLGVYKGTGLAIGKPDELQYRSGYEVFQHFRQWMRSYHEVKSNSGSEELRMLFRNYKDWEFLYVEPIKFTMKRDANKPLLYNYSIQFKVLGVQIIEKPLFDLVVSKLNEIAVAGINSYVLVKKNKAVTEYVTGTITDFQDSYNNLVFALKAANKKDLKLSELTTSDVEKLSNKECLPVINKIGQAMTNKSKDTETAEKNGYGYGLTGDPAGDGAKLIKAAKNPSTSDLASAKATLNQLLVQEPALMTNISLDVLPTALKQDLSIKQVNTALISKVAVKNIQDKAVAISNKLAEGVGLGDSTYDQIFGLTSTITPTSQSAVTDEQFEAMYAFSQIINSIDGVLSTDQMFDTNAQLFKQSNATNGADSAGVGIFSFPSPASGTKEGFLQAGVTLEDIALLELGDASRWTEIAELNNLKAPYIVTALDLLGPNYSVQSVNYTNPTQIRDLQISYFFQIPTTPSPAGAWAGKGNYIADFLGGDPTQAANWRFIYPDIGTLIQVIGTQEYFRFDGSLWGVVDALTFNIDGVLKPGDRLIIPSASTPPLQTQIQGPRDNPLTNNLSAAQKSLSVDLRLTEQMDLDLTPSGDLNVAVGSDNGAQAIILKLLYEKGSLKKFPSIGTNLTPGKKMPDIATIRTDLTTSLLQDSRIKNVTKINIIQQSGTLMLSFDVIFNDVQQPIPISIPI